MRGCVNTLILLIALGVLGAAVAYALLTRPPELAADLTPVPASGTAVARLDAKIATVQVANEPVTIEIDEEEATSKLAATLAADPNAPAIDNPQIHFRDGQIYLTGTYRDALVPVNVLVVGRVEARDGLLVTTVDRIDTGRFPLPDSIKAQLIDLASDNDRLNRELPIVVTDVRTLDGRVVLTGRPK